MRLSILFGLAAAFAAADLSAALAADAPPQASGCEIGNAVAVPMRRIAAHVDSDPQGLWTDFEIWNPNTPDKSDIWSGRARLCDGSVVTVTQIVNRQCSSATVCPARVVRQTGDRTETMLSYKQICMNRQRISVSRNGVWLTACDIDTRLSR